MYFNLFVYDEIAPNLGAITLMVQLSGVMATVATLIAGTLSDKTGNRRSFIAYGYIIWGVTVALFGMISPDMMSKLFGVDNDAAVRLALVFVIVGDCVMTLFGSTANDASFNAWVTDNTTEKNRGTIEGVLAILPLLAMLVVAGGFGILVELIDYPVLFLALGIVISLCGVIGLFLLSDKDGLEKKGSLKEIFYGLYPSVIKKHPRLYLALIIVLIYGVACQIFMPYMIIYMKTYLGFTVVEYSIIFGLAILLGAAVNLYLTRLSDKMDKASLTYIAAIVMAVGLFAMYLSRGTNKTASLVLFGLSGFVMIVGFIFTSALCGAIVRDNTPPSDVGKLQGVRMIFSVLIPMLLGPAIGNAINKARNIPLPEGSGADVMTTAYIPAPEIFLAGAITALLMIAVIPFLKRAGKSEFDSN